ncbi:MAG: RNA polymerase sigma factor [Planctomycetota bacterium]
MRFDASELSHLLDRHWGPLLAWVGPADGIAEDVVQQAFLKFSALPKRPSNPTAWLYTTARHLALTERKKLGRRRARQQAVARAESQPCEIWKSHESAELVARLDALPNELRETIVAHLWAEMTFDEIAAATHRPKATVWRQYQKGLRLLRESVVLNDQ